MTESTESMTRGEARKTARLLDRAGHYGISIVEEYPDGTIYVRSLNRASMNRTYRSFAEAKEDIR